jgi:hypothetical protein
MRTNYAQRQEVVDLRDRLAREHPEWTATAVTVSAPNAVGPACLALCSCMLCCICVLCVPPAGVQAPVTCMVRPCVQTLKRPCVRPHGWAPCGASGARRQPWPHQPLREAGAAGCGARHWCDRGAWLCTCGEWECFCWWRRSPVEPLTCAHIHHVCMQDSRVDE